MHVIHSCMHASIHVQCIYIYIYIYMAHIHPYSLSLSLSLKLELKLEIVSLRMCSLWHSSPPLFYETFQICSRRVFGNFRYHPSISQGSRNISRTVHKVKRIRGILSHFKINSHELETLGEISQESQTISQTVLKGQQRTQSILSFR